MVVSMCSITASQLQDPRFNNNLGYDLFRVLHVLNGFWNVCSHRKDTSLATPDEHYGECMASSDGLVSASLCTETLCQVFLGYSGSIMTLTRIRHELSMTEWMHVKFEYVVHKHIQLKTMPQIPSTSIANYWSLGAICWKDVTTLSDMFNTIYCNEYIKSGVKDEWPLQKKLIPEKTIAQTIPKAHDGLICHREPSPVLPFGLSLSFMSDYTS